MKLSQLRSQIDQIDQKILELLNERANLIRRVGQIKRRRGASIYVPDREWAVYQRLLRLNRGPLKEEAVKAVFREIMSGSLALEKPIQIAYLGPAATFTHQAALEKFGDSVGYAGLDSISAVFAEVEKERCDYGVVPIENSTEGVVNHTLDMFIHSDLRICSEILLEITHCLMARCSLEHVRRIYSNPQAIAQCRHWLEKHLANAELIEVSSTTKAAQLAVKNPRSAAIASRLAARQYRLNILARGIEDSTENQTRFLVIGRTIAKPTRNDKTSIMCSISDKVGALEETLRIFKDKKINLTKIESRPSKRKAWEYYFFIDLEGHCQTPKIKSALARVEKKSRFLKILGSYPAA